MNNFLIRKNLTSNLITILSFIIFVFFIGHIFFGERSFWKIFSLNSQIAQETKKYKSLLEDKKKFFAEGINVYIHNYECLKYRQLHEPFKDHLSILDLILNEGNNSMDIIRAGRKKNIKLI